MADSNTDRNLLFGVLARQMDFVTQDAFVTAMKDCTSEKHQSIGQALRSRGALSEDDDELIAALVCRLMEKHDQNARRSLAAVTAASAIRHDLEKIVDHDPNQTLEFVANSADQRNRCRDTTTAAATGETRCEGARFRLIQFHARGGLGEVWVGRDLELNREVALKQIQDAYADHPQNRARFLHEAEVTGRLEHRGIVPVYSLGHFQNGRPFYAMRFVSGTSLKAAIARFHQAKFEAPAGFDRSLELRRLLGRFVDVCNTVAYAHSRGVLHRDLKPSNIILDEYGETLVVDWGLAKTGAADPDSGVEGDALPPVSTIHTPDTRAGTTLGTPGYMSPEQAMGQLSNLGPASDVYSLGATLYCLLAGKPPFEVPDPSSILAKICAGEFPRPREVNSTVPVALEAICLKAMAVAPESRYVSARALGEEIERWLADQPVLAYPEPFTTKAIRWVRRRKQWVAAAAILLILTLLGLAIDNWRITVEQARTTDQLTMTRDALRELLKVSGENLAFIPNTEKLREYLAQLVLDRYQQLGDRFPADPGVRLETAQVFRVIGGIGRLTGQFARSQASYEKAIQALETLCENDPHQADYRRWLAEVLIDRGELNHMNGRTLDAENDFHAAIGHASKLRSAVLSVPYRRAMGSALIDLSEILVLKSQHAEAHAAADQAVELLRPLAGPNAASDATTRDRWLLSMALSDRGAASREAGDRARAAHDFDEAAQVVRPVAQDDNSYDDCQFQLACIANQRGELVGTDPARFAASHENYDQAAQILTKLINKHKMIPHYREALATALCGRAGVRLAMTKIPEAQRDCEAALDQLSWLVGEQTRKGAPENPEYLSLLGQVLAQQSRIHFLQGRLSEGRGTQSAAIEKLSRAIELDPARHADRARLERMSARPAQPKK